MIEKSIQITVGKKLGRPPFNNTGRYFKLYLPEDTYLNPNKYKIVDLNLKLKVPDENPSQIISETLLKHETLDITGEFIVTNSKYKKVVLKRLSKTKYCSYNFPKNTEIAGLYVFFCIIAPREKMQKVNRLEHDRIFFNRASSYNR